MAAGGEREHPPRLTETGVRGLWSLSPQEAQDQEITLLALARRWEIMGEYGRWWGDGGEMVGRMVGRMVRDGGRCWEMVGGWACKDGH